MAMDGSDHKLIREVKDLLFQQKQLQLEQIDISRKLDEHMQEQNALLAAAVKLLIAQQLESPIHSGAIGEAKNTLNNLGYISHYLKHHVLPE